MVTKDEVRRALDRLALSGGNVCIHSSLRTLGSTLEGGLDGLVSVFLERGCTLLVPTFSDMFTARPAAGSMPRQNGVGDYSCLLQRECEEEKTFAAGCRDVNVEKMGLLSWHILRTEGSVRGSHPLNSFTALGPNAAALVSGQTPRDVYAPFRRLYESGGFVLLMGVSLCRATIIHYAEQRAGRTAFVRWARIAGGTTVPAAVGGCSRGFDRLYGPLSPFEKTAAVGQSAWSCYRAQDIVDICVKEIRTDPAITHCGDPLCARCRDAVRGGPLIEESFWTESLV